MIGVRAASSASSASSLSSRQEMLELFQPWVLATYGDSAKTKTITLRKAHRIQGSPVRLDRRRLLNRFCS